MNVTSLLRRRPPECPTCRQPIVQPTPSIVAAARAGFAAFGLGAALLEYRRAVKREREEAQLSRAYDQDIDRPLDEHLARRDDVTGTACRDHCPAGATRGDDPYRCGECGHPISWHRSLAEEPTADWPPNTPEPVAEATPWPPAHPSLAALDDASDAAD